MRLYPAYPGNPRRYIEGESPHLWRRYIQSSRHRIVIVSAVHTYTLLPNAADRSFLRTLDLDRSPHLFEGSLDLLGLVPRYALNDVLWRSLDEILRFLQPEARDRSDFPDHFDFHPANGLENDRELALFLRLSDLGRRRQDRLTCRTRRTSGCVK